MSVFLSVDHVIGILLGLAGIIIVFMLGIWAAVSELKAFAYYLRLRADKEGLA